MTTGIRVGVKLTQPKLLSTPKFNVFPGKCAAVWLARIMPSQNDPSEKRPEDSLR